MTAPRSSTADLLRSWSRWSRANLNRHLAAAKEWFPHEYVPWSQGTDFDGVARRRGVGTRAVAALRRRPDLADRQPAHRGQPAELPPRDRDAVRPRRRLGHLGAPVDRRGGPARHRDPRLPARHPGGRPGRAGAGPDDPHGAPASTNAYGDQTALHGIAYVSFQELATRVSHRNTGRISGDPICDQLLARVAADENLHMIFYRNLLGGRLRAGARTRRCGRSATWSTTSRCPATASRTSAARRCRSPWPASTTCASTTTRWSPRCCATLKALETRRAVRRRRAKARDELVEFLAELDQTATKFTERRESLNARRTGRVPDLASRNG